MENRCVRIAWVDDAFPVEMEGRKEIAANYHSYLSSEYRIELGQVEIDLCHDIDAFLSLQTQFKRPFDIVILDIAGIDSRQKPLDAEELAKTLSSQNTIVAVYSTHPPRDALYFSIVEPKPQDWRFRDPKNSDELIRRVATQIRSFPLTVLHLSDFHFGRIGDGLSNPFDSDYGSLQNSLELLMEEVAQKLNNKQVDKVILSGDLTIAGKVGNYLQFQQRVLEPIAERIGLRNIIIVPGNHDLDIGGDEGANRLYNFSTLLKPFLDHERINALTAGAIGALRKSYFYSDPKTGLLVLCIDSTCKTDHQRSEIPLSMIENLRLPDGLWRYKIAVFHHNLLPVPSDRTANDSTNRGANQVIHSSCSLIKKLGELGISVVLHGHSHYSNTTSLRATYGSHSINNLTSIGVGPFSHYSGPIGRQFSNLYILNCLTSTMDICYLSSENTSPPAWEDTCGANVVRSYAIHS